MRSDGRNEFGDCFPLSGEGLFILRLQTEMLGIFHLSLVHPLKQGPILAVRAGNFQTHRKVVIINGLHMIPDLLQDRDERSDPDDTDTRAQCGVPVKELPEKGIMMEECRHVIGDIKVENVEDNFLEIREDEGQNARQTKTPVKVEIRRNEIAQPGAHDANHGETWGE